MDCLPPMDYSALWHERRDAARRWVSEEFPALDAHQAEAKALGLCFPRFLLDCFGQEVRQTRATPWATLAGRRAVELLAVEKYRWTPTTARELSDGDLILALHKELSRFKLPDEALDACRDDFNAAEMTEFIDHGASHFFKEEA